MKHNFNICKHSGFQNLKMEFVQVHLQVMILHNKTTDGNICHSDENQTKLYHHHYPVNPISNLSLDNQAGLALASLQTD